MAVREIGESALQLLTNALADYGAQGAEMVSSPLLFARGFGNEAEAEEFARLKAERRRKLPTYTPSEETTRAQQEIFAPVAEWAGGQYEEFSEENPNLAETLEGYISDPRVMHTLGAMEIGIPSGARATRAFMDRDVPSPTRNSQTGNVDFFGSGSKRTLKEGIYKDPQTLAREAEAMVAPESPALGELFGTSREELSDIARRSGNVAGEFFEAPKPRGSIAAKQIMTPQNEDRLRDALVGAEMHAPRLVEGMDGWYVLDPWKDKFVERLGGVRGLEQYSKWNALTTMNSPGAPVDWEIPRGSSAYMLDEQGRIEDWFRYAGMPKGQRGADFPQDIFEVQGHPYHTTAHSKPIRGYLETGEHLSKEPKVPLYRQASEAPEIGFQTDTPIPDAHWSRAVGLGDVRGGSRPQWGKSASGTEMTDLAPWWRERIAGEIGIESVPAQARTWGLFAPQTGVETAIGAPKLELIADSIMETSRRMDISPQEAMDRIIEGTAYAGR
jgi:hypothetical protein